MYLSWVMRWGGRVGAVTPKLSAGVASAEEAQTRPKQFRRKFMAIQAKNLTTVDAIRKAIKSVTGRAASLQADIQVIAIACLDHTIKHGDWTLSVELIKGISAANGMKKTALINWHEAFMQARYEENADGGLGFSYDEGKNHETILIDMAKAVNWFDFKKPPAKHVYDLTHLMDTVEKELNKKDSLVPGIIKEEIAGFLNSIAARMAEAEAEAEAEGTRKIEEYLKLAA
jgi:hypothetical protein